jgi:hypothetical protein
MIPGSHLAVFENNPWNPGTRMVMHRIPFDRDAIPLSILELRSRMKAAGYEVRKSRSLFYLPKPLAALRFIEPLLVRVPLGAQYYVLARVPSEARTVARPRTSAALGDTANGIRRINGRPPASFSPIFRPNSRSLAD